MNIKKIKNMEVIQVKDYDEMSEVAAELVLKKLEKIKQPVLGLATGSTPEGLYKLMIKAHVENGVSFSDVATFNLDEYIGLPEDNEQSYHYFMNEKLLNHLDIPKEKSHIPDGLARDLHAACDDFEKAIKEAGGIDLQLLGLGINGHIGFNEPGTPVTSRTHIIELDDITREVNARFFENEADVPTKAVTMGIGTILEADHILFIVHGEEKADILRQVIHGEVTTDIPASALQLHPNVTVITDIPL